MAVVFKYFLWNLIVANILQLEPYQTFKKQALGVTWLVLLIQIKTSYLDFSLYR